VDRITWTYGGVLLRTSQTCYYYALKLMSSNEYGNSVNSPVNTFPLGATRATIGRLLLGNGSVNTPKTIRDDKRCFPWDLSRGVITIISKGAASCRKLREFN
jgi:hypothetical protein